MLNVTWTCVWPWYDSRGRNLHYGDRNKQFACIYFSLSRWQKGKAIHPKQKWILALVLFYQPQATAAPGLFICPSYSTVTVPAQLCQRWSPGPWALWHQCCCSSIFFFVRFYLDIFWIQIPNNYAIGIPEDEYYKDPWWQMSPSLPPSLPYHSQASTSMYFVHLVPVLTVNVRCMSSGRRLC